MAFEQEETEFLQRMSKAYSDIKGAALDLVANDYSSMQHHRCRDELVRRGSSCLCGDKECQ